MTASSAAAAEPLKRLPPPVASRPTSRTSPKPERGPPPVVARSTAGKSAGKLPNRLSLQFTEQLNSTLGGMGPPGMGAPSPRKATPPVVAPKRSTAPAPPASAAPAEEDSAADADSAQLVSRKPHRVAPPPPPNAKPAPRPRSRAPTGGSGRDGRQPLKPKRAAPLPSKVCVCVRVCVV